MFGTRIRKIKLLRAELKLKREQVKLETDESRLVESRLGFLPHIMVNTSIYRDGSRWVCRSMFNEDETKDVIAYGESPAQACSNFDALWNGAPGFIIEDQPEEEEEY